MPLICRARSNWVRALGHIPQTPHAATRLPRQMATSEWSGPGPAHYLHDLLTLRAGEFVAPPQRLGMISAEGGRVSTTARRASGSA